MKKIWAIGIIAVLVLVGIGLVMAPGFAGNANDEEKVEAASHGHAAPTEKGDPPKIAKDISAVSPGGIIIQSGRAGSWTVPAGGSQYRRIYFPKAFSTRPVVVWTAEIYPWNGKIDYGIDMYYIGTTYFDCRVTSSDSRSVKYYVNWIACGV